MLHHAYGRLQKNSLRLARERFAKDHKGFAKLCKCRSSSKSIHRLQAEMNDSPSTDDPALSVDEPAPPVDVRGASDLRHLSAKRSLRTDLATCVLSAM